MTPRILLLAGAVLLAGGPLWAADVTQVSYDCDRGVTVPVTYVNTEKGAAVAVLHIDNRQIAAVLVRSASGARYRSSGGDGRYVWLTKGRDAFLVYERDGAEADIRVLDNCRTRNAFD